MQSNQPDIVDNLSLTFPLHTPNSKGILCAFLGYSLFAVSNALMKGTASDVSVYNIVFWNDVFALLAVFALHRQLGGFRKTLQTRYLKFHLLRSVLLTLQFICLIFALAAMPMANSYSLFFCAPLITTFLAIPFLKEKAHLFHWISLLGGITGILIILNPEARQFNMGVLYALASALLVSLGNLANRKIGQDETKFSFAFYPILSTLIISGGLSLAEFKVPEARHMFMLALAGIGSGTGVLLVGMAFTLTSTAAASSFLYIQMVWAVVLGYLMFGDVLTLRIAAGSAFIIVSGLYLVWHEKKGNEKTF
ncbi:MAG: DMT family transporter [Rhodospirillales bacterium]|nr:MAG: DMT family transporter [Rhodospirillales bacterium]